MDPDRSPHGDFVLSFDIARAGVRGRLVRLDAASARALGAHVLPEPAARVTGEMVALGALLGTALKLDGRLTIQTKGDGPLDLVTADYYGADENRDLGVRGYARLDAQRFAALEVQAFDKLAGKGALAITIEPRLGGKTYQGIVELSPDGIGASAETYFAQSEQLPTVIRLAAAPLYVAGDPSPRWRAGGLMLQMTPETARHGNERSRTTGSGCRCCSHCRGYELVTPASRRKPCCGGCSTKTKCRVRRRSVIFRCDCDAPKAAYAPRNRGPEI